MLYTFEFIFCIFILLLLIGFWKLKGEKKSLYVYIITGLLHSVIELTAQGSGIRVISETYLFGKIYVTYPFLPFILGFFEGGFYCLMAYHFVRIMIHSDRFSLKFFSTISICIFILISLGAIAMHSGTYIITRRAIFNIGNLILLSICIGVSLGYFLLNKNVTSEHRKSFFYYYLGLVLITAIMVIPLHIAGTRFIEVCVGGTYYYASIPEQILVMYGYSLVFEAAGYFLPFYIIIYHFKLIEFKASTK